MHKKKKKKKKGAPTTQEAVTSGGAFIRDALQGFGLSPSASALIQESWRPGTRVQYDSLLRGWQGFCSQRKVLPLSPTIFDVISYLTSMYDRGLQHTTIASARSVLSRILHIPGVTSISSHPLIIRLLKGIFHVRPPKPRYEFIWDTEIVLQFLKNLHPSAIGLKLLTLKTVTLLTLLSGQRVSTLHQFRLSQMQRTPTIVVFNIQGLLKQSRPTKRDLPITHAFPHDVALCPVATLGFYLSAREKNAALHDELFLCYRNPHGPATRDTLSRWVRMVLGSSGVNLDTFFAHSCRSASTSKAAASGVSLERILMAGQWSTSSTFYEYYRKDIVVSDHLLGPCLPLDYFSWMIHEFGTVFAGIIPCVMLCLFMLLLVVLLTLIHCIDLYF